MHVYMYVYRQSQARKSTDSGVKCAECSLSIGTGCRVQVFAWSSIAQSVCPRAESYKVAEYIDHFLQEISQKHPSYIKDTHDFLSKLRTAKVQPHTIVITLDVESMYTNIGNEQGLEAVRNIFQASPSLRRSNKHILELLELSLRYHDFELNNETFLRISGTAVGKKSHPVMQICSGHNRKIQPWKMLSKTNKVL